MYEVTLTIEVPPGMHPAELASPGDFSMTQQIESLAIEHGCVITKNWDEVKIAEVKYLWPDKETYDNFKSYINTIFDQEALVARRTTRIESLGGSITITKKEI